jgi:hypothetical protein
MDPKVLQLLTTLEKEISSLTGRYMAGELNDEDIKIRLNNLAIGMDDRIAVALHDYPRVLSYKRTYN